MNYRQSPNMKIAMLFQNPIEKKQKICLIIKVQLGLNLWMLAVVVSVKHKVIITHWTIMKVDFGGILMNKQQKIFKFVSVFLHYPEREWIDQIETIKRELNGLNAPK